MILLLPRMPPVLAGRRIGSIGPTALVRGTGDVKRILRRHTRLGNFIGLHALHVREVHVPHST
jgi:hypothetical protein